jgi:hypothetical protein
MALAEKGIVAGEDVYIVGSGASLLDEPLERLTGKIIFGVGNALARWSENPLHFDFFGFHAIEEQQPNDIWARKLGAGLFCGWQEGDKAAYGEKASPDGYHMVFRNHAKPLNMGCLGDVDGEFTWAAQSVSVGLAVGVQGAMWLGARRIILLGHDFNPSGYVSNIHEPRGGDANVAPMWQPGGERIVQIEKELGVLWGECGTRGIELWNATRHTAETVLPKFSLDD